MVLIGHGNRDHATSSNRWRLERFTTFLSKPDMDRLQNKTLQAPSVGGGCVMPFIYYPNHVQIHFIAADRRKDFQQIVRPNQPVWLADTFHKGNLVFIFFASNGGGCLVSINKPYFFLIVLFR